MQPVRVRFAPSPTGFLHVGGARTAILNWLYARHHGGTFVLRVEDTDRQRSSDEVVQAILDGMDWLGMQPDEGPFFQSEARPRHVADAGRLLERGAAYRCFCSAETIREQRAAAEKAGGGYTYPRTCLALTAEESGRRAADGEPFAVRFEIPPGRISWDDAVHGTTGFDAGVIEDFVILRSDGSPTYMLSVVSDDVAMGITHVIRGDDHVSNTPKQIVLYRALEQPIPTFAHLPLILGEDRKRLSKRHGAVSVLDYREQGYLAEAMFNFLALLGWSPGDDRQKLDRETLCEIFGLEGVGRSGAVFDVKKLEWLNGQYLAEMPPEALEPLVRPRLEAAGLWHADLAGDGRERYLATLALLQPRCRRPEDFVEQARPFLQTGDELEYEEKAARKHLKGDDLPARLEGILQRFRDLDAWNAADLEEALRLEAESRDLSAGKLIHPIRLALTGRGASPGLFEVLELLGRERSLRRIERLLEHVSG